MFGTVPDIYERSWVSPGPRFLLVYLLAYTLFEVDTTFSRSVDIVRVGNRLSISHMIGSKVVV